MRLFRLELVSATIVIGAAGLTADLSHNAWRERPITKIVNLLKDMAAQLHHEAEEDEDMYTKLTCWCAENDKEKTKAIEVGNERVASLQSAIESYTATSSQLDTQLKSLNQNSAKLSDALEEASGIRSKEQVEFEAEEKDSLATIASLKSAVQTMAKSQGAVFIQGVGEQMMLQKSLLHPQTELQAVATAQGDGFIPRDGEQMISQESLLQLETKLHHIMRTHEGFLQQKQMTAISLIQQQVTSRYRVRQPASGQIFGILQGMKESFEQNLANAQKDETTAKEQFESMKAAKKSEMKATKDLIDTKSAELAETIDKTAQAKQDLKDSRATLKADEEFLLNLKQKCQTADQEYEGRQQMRMDEVTAVTETIDILTKDEAAQTLSDSTFVQASFLQIRSKVRTGRQSLMLRNKAARLLQKTGIKFRSEQILAFAGMTRAGAFEKIREKMKKLITELKKSKTQEENEKNTCQEQIKHNQRDTAAKKSDKGDTEQQMADIEAVLGKLNEEIEAAKATVQEMQLEMKRAGMNREAESKDFQITVQDQRATQTILAKALQRLKDFYGKRSFLQSSGNQDQPKQASYKKSGGASPVIAMLEHILHESKEIEKKALEAENQATESYETFLKDSNDSIKALSKDIVNKRKAMAGADQEHVEANEDLKQITGDLLKLAEFGAALHADCDWLIKNFDERQAALQEEIDGLIGAIAILGG